MDLKIKYQYTYFIYPYIVKENRYTKYLLKLLKDKNCKLKTFRKEKELDMYSYFSNHAKNYIFNSFNLSKARISKLEELPLETRAALLAKNECTMFEYTIKNDIQGKLEEKNGIFFKIPKIEIICFNTGICFLCIKTNIEGSDKFSDVLNFNYKFKDINQEFSNMNNYDNIRVQTDSFSDVEYFKEFIESITGGKLESIKLDINTEKFFTYSYACIDQEQWNDENSFEKIKNMYDKFVHILPNDENIKFSDENAKSISEWKYAKLGITKQGVTLLCSSYDMNNYTKLPQQFEEEYLYTYIIAMYTKLYLKKINVDFRKAININKSRKEFTKFTRELWINEVTMDDIGALYYQYLKNVFELDAIFFDTKNKYDVLYKQMNIEKMAKINKKILIILTLTLIVNIINVLFLGK